MLAQDSDYYTPEEYLAREEKAQYKSEYRQGKIFALAGASVNHNRIIRNTLIALTNAFEGKPCEAFVNDLRLWIQAKKLFTYPDVMVVCGDPQFAKGRTDTITNPKVIIEVLSESTAAYDRGDKFQAYWTLESFEEYVLIDQYRSQVEYFRRLSEKEWKLLVLTKADEVLKLASIEAEILLNQIYRHVAWEDNYPVSR